MDPNAAWELIRDGIGGRDGEMVAGAASVLIGWVRTGGFQPRTLTELSGGDSVRAIKILKLIRGAAEARHPKPIQAR